MEKLYQLECLLFDIDSLFYGDSSEHPREHIPDINAVMELPQILRLGAFSTQSNHRLWQSQNLCGVAWRIACVAQREDLWQKLQENLEDHDLDTYNCLLISSNPEMIHAAAEQGYLTCFVAGTSPAKLVQDTEADVTVADLNQMEHGLKAMLGKPIRYRVTVTAVHEKYAREFIRWMRDEHGPELLGMDGCQEFRVFKLTPTTVSCEYLFKNQHHLDKYLTHHAPGLREKGRERFPSEIMNFQRDDSVIELQGYK